MPLRFHAATDAEEARWVESALRQHDFAQVGSTVPSSAFDATVAVRHPAWRCECKDDADAAKFASGHGKGAPIRWTDAVAAGLPVLYGSTSEKTRYGWTKNLGTQYRRIDTGWVVQTLPDGGVATLIRPGDRWIDGPSEGTAPTDIAQILHDILAPATQASASCWFGVWEGLGYFTDQDRAGASISTPQRRWLLLRGTLRDMLASFDPYPLDDHSQSPNLVWPHDRAWCLATEIDAEVTLVAGARALIDTIVACPDLEASEVDADNHLPWFGDLLQPVVDQPADVELPAGFETRRPPKWITEAQDEQMAQLIGEDQAWLRRSMGKMSASSPSGWGRVIFIAKADGDGDVDND